MVGTLRAPWTKGDVALKWDTDDPKSQEAVKQEFDELIANNFTVIDVKGQKELKSFDPQATEQVAVLPIAGG